MAISIIKDFLSNSDFQSLIKSLEEIESKKGNNESNTVIEKKKEVFKIDSLASEIMKVIEIQANNSTKEKISELTGWTGKIYSLLEIEGFGGYAPMHKMKKGGFLGSHVDHSYVDNGDLIHIANSIFYAVSDWKNDWQGETILFDKSGYREIKKIIPEPNKLLLFTHDSESFHGVNRITCPDDVFRVTFYMDYYIAKEDLYEFSKSFLKTTGEDFHYFKYLTMFIPLPTENGKFLWHTVFKSQFKGYLRNYMGYLSESLLAKDMRAGKKFSIKRCVLIFLIKAFDSINGFIKSFYNKVLRSSRD